ncbi:hypothetical protein [Emticicia sp. W12TSBA100-4]|uniref:hypothetical protein n=1 Tax=Emticicia sp. W12TSBA100-4 TaxID=3160965 RepID=UPI0033058CFB
MKKLIITFSFLLSSAITFCQSVTISPTSLVENPIQSITKVGIGLDHRHPNGLVGVGTFAQSASGYIQTHTNHPLHFSTNNGPAHMTITTAGQIGMGTITPSQKLHVVGNTYITGNMDSDGLVSAGTLSIGGGSTINKYLEVALTGQQIFGVVNNTCDLNYYAVAGVNTGDAVILNMESAFSTLVVANVRASGANQVEVKFCNIGNSNTVLLQNLNMRFTVFK